MTDRIGVLVDLEKRTVCTAFCVGESVVMTAAHCLSPATDGRSADDRARRLDNLLSIRWRRTLTAGRDEARIETDGRTGTAASILLGTMTLSLRPPIDAVSDWALVRLDRPVCPAGGLAMSRRPTEELLALARERRLYNLAVHRDFESFALALGAPCPAARSFDGANWSVISRDFSRADDLLFHTCDTGGSSSGSPLLVDGPAGPEVVGLNVGTYLQSTAGIAREAAASAAATRPARDIANTAIAAHSLADRVDEFVARTTVRSPAALRQIQDALARQGAYAGPRDGRMRVSLSIAIKAFEARVGLPVTGRPTEGLRRLLVAMHDE